MKPTLAAAYWASYPQDCGQIVSEFFPQLPGAPEGPCCAIRASFDASDRTWQIHHRRRTISGSGPLPSPVEAAAMLTTTTTTKE